MSDKILIVDDDREIRDVLRVLLTGERFEVAEASSGEEALYRSCIKATSVLLFFCGKGRRFTGTAP